jgi:hypothetical protein
MHSPRGGADFSRLVPTTTAPVSFAENFRRKFNRGVKPQKWRFAWQIGLRKGRAKGVKSWSNGGLTADRQGWPGAAARPFRSAAAPLQGQPREAPGRYDAAHFMRSPQARQGAIVIAPVAVPLELVVALSEAGLLDRGQVDKRSLASAVERLFRRLARRRDFLTL